MRVVVPLEHRFQRTPDGRVWTHTMFGRSFWERYLDVFDGVHVIARNECVDEPSATALPADGPGITFAQIPAYRGPRGFLRKYIPVTRAVRSALGPEDAVILRIGSTMAACLTPKLRRENRPYGVEVVCDPYDIFAPKAVDHPLRPVLRLMMSKRMRRDCARAAAASYVTEFTLQRRYPVKAGGFSTHYSNVELPTAAFAAAPRTARRSAEDFHIVSVGSMDQRYKGFDVLIEAVARGRRQGIPLRLTLIGNGVHREELERQARATGCGDVIRFAGTLPAGEAVRSVLDSADLFVLASRTEGLPRALIEAMARALPCLGTSVGGIPELLDAEQLVPADDAAVLAKAICDVWNDSARWVQMSQRNLARAADFHDDVLRTRRVAFYETIRDETLAWMSRRDSMDRGARAAALMQPSKSR